MSATLEQRVAALEAEVARLKSNEEAETKPWWEKVRGAFKNDPVYDEINRLGEEYRRAQPVADYERETDDFT